MPWCEECAKYWAPSAMTPEGRCPACGRDLAAPTRRPPAGAAEEPIASGAGTGVDADADADAKAPWHFKLMVALLVAYLTWRFVELLT